MRTQQEVPEFLERVRCYIVGFTRNPPVKVRCSLHSQMSVCRVLGKLSNHVIEVVFFSMEEDTYMVLRSTKE